MQEDWHTEFHPDWYHDISPMRFLILGSFPPHPKRRAYEFYYPNRRNRFWRILSELAKQELCSTKEHNDNAVQERYLIMKKLNTGVQNLGYEIQRKGHSALDRDIKIVKFHDVLSIINCHPELQRILLPGFSAPNSTARSFIKYLEGHGIEVSVNIPLRQGTTFKFGVNGRDIECVVLNSTSPVSKIKYEIVRDQFRNSLTLDEMACL